MNSRWKTILSIIALILTSLTGGYVYNSNEVIPGTQHVATI
jgi:hypothetical protein